MFLVEISALGTRFENSYNHVFKILATKGSKVIGGAGYKSEYKGETTIAISESETEAEYAATQEKIFGSIFGKGWADPGRNILITSRFTESSIAEVATKTIEEGCSFSSKVISSAAAKLVAEFIDEEHQEDDEPAQDDEEELGSIEESERLAMLRRARETIERRHDAMAMNAMLGVSEKPLDVDELLEVIESQADSEIDGLLELEQEQERARRQSMRWGMF